MLSHAERIALLRYCAGRLQADSDPATKWLGQQLTAALTSGQSLDAALGFRPAQGSRATAAAIIRREALDRDIARLVDRYGVTTVSEILRGKAHAASELGDMVARLQSAGVGVSASAVSRAVCRVRHKS